jgi:hypothetical protein
MNVVIFWLPKMKRLDVRVTLSRRNLRTLLLKLADPDSKRTISRDVEPGLRLEVHAESDEVHYAERPPGQMTLWTEAALQAGLDGEGEAL